MKLRRGVGIALFGAGLVVLSCSADRGSVPIEASADASVSPASATTLVESRTAATRITELRKRFRVPVRAAEDERSGLARATLAKRAAPTALPALGAPVATRFESAAGPDAATHVRAVLPTEVLRGVARPAHVALPVRANDEVKLEDATSHVSVRFALEHVQDARIEVAEGMALYRGALDGADVVHRVHAEGTEDFVIFEARPAREELSYSVDVSRVPGLRLVSNTLEFLDPTGTPVLRVAPPYVVDAKGQRHEAKLAVNGCAYDTSPAGPWGRKVTKPGADRCEVDVAWGGDIAYPAMVDPAWSATGSMASGRQDHTASLLPSGKVLVAGGQGAGGGNTYLASAELFDPAGNAGAGTFAATGPMATARGRHTASALPSGKVLVAGGYNAGGLPLSSAELFDPAGNVGAGTFTATGSMATARDYHTASVLPSGKVLVAGGNNDVVGTLSSAELFDPAGNAGSGTFTATGSMAAARVSHTASVLPSGRVLVAAGMDNTAGLYLSSAELFDPAGNAGGGTFSATGSMAAVRVGHTASVLPSGKVLVAGGDSGLAILPSAELFDLAGNAGGGTFTATGSMATARVYHTASVLPSGKVLVAGGLSLSSAELYDPAGNAGTGTFAATGSLATARSEHTASVLASGNVLVTGGLNHLSSAELYGGTLGEACAATAPCLSGFCADGLCCNAACSGGGCDRCDLPGQEGTCTVAPSGNPGANAACAFPLACDGANAACPITCASDAACAANYYCAPDATCRPRKAQASVCNPQTDCKDPAACRECTSGSCADGFCCDAPCTGLCQACSAALKQSGLANGTCGPVKDHTNPHNDNCPSSGPTTCGPDGKCDGAGACRLYYAPTTSCGASVCAGTVVKGQLCNGSGTCATNAAGVDCDPFLCTNGACTTSCVTTNDCAADGWCNAGTCEKKLANGALCPTMDACTSGHCADGVCCDTACLGQCEACDNATGSCAPVIDAPHGVRAACAIPDPSNPCSATKCDGSTRATCARFVGTEVVCGTASCIDRTSMLARTCDAKGACKPLETVPCGAYACGTAGGCNTSCTKADDCAPGSTCDAATQKCVGSNATCDGDHTTKSVDGTTQDCVPYKCDSNGTCRAACTSVNDCVAPTICDPTGKCVAPPADTGSGGGCSVVSARDADARGQVGWFAAAAGLALVRRRRRRGVKAASPSAFVVVGRSGTTRAADV